MGDADFLEFVIEMDGRERADRLADVQRKTVVMLAVFGADEARFVVEQFAAHRELVVEEPRLDQ